MNDEVFRLSEGIIAKNYVTQAQQARKQREQILTDLLSQRKLPDEGLDEQTIEMILRDMSSMDSNNFVENIGVGDREGRVYSSIVARRNFYFSHGIGRSGDLLADQPKAAGGSLLYKITSSLVTYCFTKCIGFLPHVSSTSSKTNDPPSTKIDSTTKTENAEESKSATTNLNKEEETENSTSLKRTDNQKENARKHKLENVVLPVATGMAISVTLLSIRNNFRQKGKKVIWFRIDQKTCLKAIISSGFTPVIINPIPSSQNKYELVTNVEELEQILFEYSSKKMEEEILCVVSTTSCFAPRAPDKLVEISILCHKYGIPHVVNNAYGLQSSNITHLINEGSRKGRIDCFIQSTDKNFMVPVGGSIIASYNLFFNITSAISSFYPGRASISPILDLFITLLHLGKKGFTDLLTERKEMYEYMKNKLNLFAIENKEVLIATSNNAISFAISLSQMSDDEAEYIGSMLFSRFVSGTRVVVRKSKSVCGITFKNYGAHIDDYEFPYLTASCTIGITKNEIDVFLERLHKVFVSFQKQKQKKLAPATPSNSATPLPNTTPFHSSTQ